MLGFRCRVISGDAPTERSRSPFIALHFIDDTNCEFGHKPYVHQIQFVNCLLSVYRNPILRTKILIISFGLLGLGNRGLQSLT